METLTSTSLEYFFLVAVAKAISIALKIISLSTPFSFETASTTFKISLLILISPDYIFNLALSIESYLIS